MGSTFTADLRHIVSLETLTESKSTFIDFNIVPIMSVRHLAVDLYRSKTSHKSVINLAGLSLTVSVSGFFFEVEG
jgi:hypothetical protein